MDVLPNARLNKFLQREINDLQVHCQHHEEGCKWTGEVRDLQSHLDPIKRRCNYILLPCSFGCGERIQSGAMKEHKSTCLKRQTSCQYCSYYSLCDIVTTIHIPICPLAPVTCPNNCKVTGLKRKQLQVHIDECQLQVIFCPFASAGCTVKLPRNEMEKHEATAVCEHLRLLMKLHLKQEAPTPTAAIPSTLLFNLAPTEIVIPNFLAKKAANEEWHSSHFYTHSKGYRFRLEVCPNGFNHAKGSHLSVFAALMRGEYDNDLKWPFEGDIIFELLNWREDKNHHLQTTPFNRYNDPDGKHTSRVINKEAGPGLGITKFIPHADLSSTTNTEYLQDDYLKIRVSVGVYSTLLVPPCPSWQDPLINSQSPFEFTISEFSKRKKFNNFYCSPPFTTDPLRYKLCLLVHSNGHRDGKNNHLSIYAYIMKGQHDDSVQWPFTGEITIELINWVEDKRHYKKTLTINVDANFTRVTTGEYGSHVGFAQFISHSSLNPSTNTQYLYQDCIRVRVKAIAII